MSVKDFMKANLITINQIIKEIPMNPFDSHDFIKRFAKRFERDYVAFLSIYDTEPFHNVHSQIGSFLVENQDSLDIRDNGKTQSENIFGNRTTNESWLKV